MFDERTSEYTEGVVPKMFRRFSGNKEKKWKFINFNGPVDAVWIEDMNTVLDDNKKLCLTSGDIIKMNEWMKILFETEDLNQASPATVSRVGIVFMQPKDLCWQVAMKSQLNNIKSLPEDKKEVLTQILN